jgi:signal transduction histidine kinase
VTVPRPRGIKARLGVVIVAGVLVSAAAALALVGAGLPVWAAALAGAALALALVQALARGLTAPLRAMAAASRALAGGEHDVRVAEGGAAETRELARAFNLMAAELAETDRRRRELVANVSHELRTPIGALQAKLENVADGVERADAETVEAMLAQTRRLGRLVAQLLDLSRLEAQDGPFDVRPFAVADVLDAAAREARLHAPEGVEVRVRAEPGLRVAGDPERVHQVVANLVENALRVSPRPGVVAVTAAGDGPARVRLEVADQGPGIPEQEATRVFERFHRLDAARSADGGGAGLGLAIVRWIVERHGGAIRVERAEPRGCRMVVELPGVAA